jgi:hypothetical protein
MTAKIDGRAETRHEQLNLAKKLNKELSASFGDGDGG